MTCFALWQRLSPLMKYESGSSESFFWLVPDLGLCSFPIYSSFSKNPAGSVYWKSQILIPYHPALASTRILLASMSSLVEIPKLWCFLSVIFYSLTLTCSLVINLHCPFICSWAQSHSSTTKSCCNSSLK